jgi:beta-lactamase regulating signal transducer with metallopeptidase domain
MYSVAIRVAVVLLATSLLAGLLNRASAATRHLVHLVGLSIALLLPAAYLTLPEWSAIPLADTVPVVLIKASEAVGTSFNDTGVGAHLDTLLFSFWSIGALLVLARIFIGQLVLARWRRQAHPVTSQEWRTAIALVSRRSATAQRVTFLECNWIDAPCTWGIARQTVLLPQAGRDWGVRQCEIALVHELAHAERFDAATTLIARVACAVHWYNPWVWKTARNAALSLEEACDNAVLTHNFKASEYAALLMNVSKTSALCSTAMAPVLALVRPTDTATRVRSVLDVQRRRSPLSARLVVAAMTVGTASLLSVSTLSAAQNRNVAQARPDSLTIAQAARRMCAARMTRRDTSTTVRFTFRGKTNAGSASNGSHATTYEVVVKNCGNPARS